MRIGSKRKPVPPSDADFDSAEVWRMTVPRNALDGVADVRLRVAYAGDVARAYIGDRLIDDDFYYGQPWEIGLKRFAPDVFDAGITLKILPTPKGSPIYIQDDCRPRLRADGTEAGFDGAELLRSRTGCCLRAEDAVWTIDHDAVSPPADRSTNATLNLKYFVAIGIAQL